MDVAALIAEVGRDAEAHLAEAYALGMKEATITVGLTVAGKRGVVSYRSPGAELAAVPALNSVFEIGSVSKVYTTTLLALLERQGLLLLDDPIGKHLPNVLRLKPEIAALTIREVATHSSGLPAVGQIHKCFQEEELRGWTLAPFGITTHYLRYRKEHLYKDLETVDLSYPTGTGWLYSILGMGTVGHILELVTGRPYEELLREFVCEPLGLSDTAYSLSVAQQLRVVRAFFPHGQPTPSWYHDVLMPQGGLRSTMNDMLTFAEANIRAGRQQDDTPLAQAMRLARAPHFTLPIEAGSDDELSRHWIAEVRQGLAWRGMEAPRDQASWHPGTTPFYQSLLAVDDESEVGLVLLSSSHDSMYFMEPLSAVVGLKPLAPRFLAWFERACAIGR